MRWEPIAAMVALFLLGIWLVAGPSRHPGIGDLRPGAVTHELRIGGERGLVEVVEEGDHNDSATFRILYRDGFATPVMSGEEFDRVFGAALHDHLVRAGVNPFFRLFNITSWSSLAWILIGLGGQVAFFARMAVQWIVSERECKSTVPPVFWYLSFGGGIALFAYFAWRQDLIGVLGQTTGIVIYARNIRLIRKQALREAVAAPARTGGAGARA